MQCQKLLHGKKIQWINGWDGGVKVEEELPPGIRVGSRSSGEWRKEPVQESSRVKEGKKGSKRTTAHKPKERNGSRRLISEVPY